MLFLNIINWAALALVILLALLILFEPPLRYSVRGLSAATDSKEFLGVVCALAVAEMHPYSGVETLTDGKTFYPAELEAIRNAVWSVHIEVFIFRTGAIGDRFLAALVERARNGVQVKVVVDAFGSFLTPDNYFQRLRDAGGEVRWYQPFRLANFKRWNNRTHRKLITIDGTIGFIGGAGIARHWDGGDNKHLPWRDMMFKLEGPLVTGLQSTFAENWLESSGEILANPADYLGDAVRETPGTRGMVVMSTPTAGRSSRTRILFQVLLAGAGVSIDIHSPYFLPDRSATEELVRASRDRGVRVRVIVPGSTNNHPLSRLASRRRYGPLLNAGVEIYEYWPGMLHTKTMTVDGLWVVIGSTNFDSRSFDLNDEVNMVAVDRHFAEQIGKQFEADLLKCHSVTNAQWSRRSMPERVASNIARVFERQE